MESQSSECHPEEMKSEDLLFMLYTSGSTGKPKGIAHSTAGYLLYAGITQKVCVPQDKMYSTVYRRVPVACRYYTRDICTSGELTAGYLLCNTISLVTLNFSA